MIIRKENENEEKVLLNNIMSLVQQLLQSEGSEEMTGEEDMQSGNELEANDEVLMALDAEDKEDKKDEKDEEVNKSTIDTPSDGSVANDDSEELIEEPLTNITEETIDEVAKAILNKIGFKSNVKKSVKNDSSSTNKVLNELVKINKNLLARQEVTENAIGNLINGLGIANEIEKSYAVKEEQQVRKGLNNPKDAEATLAYIAKALNIQSVEKEESTLSNIDKVRKSLADKSILASLVAKR